MSKNNKKVSLPVLRSDNHLAYCSDDRLKCILEYTEELVADKTLMQALPDGGALLNIRLEKIYKEMHKRKFELCLEELYVILSFRYNKLRYVREWLQEISPAYEGGPVSSKRKRGVKRSYPQS